MFRLSLVKSYIHYQDSSQLCIQHWSYFCGFRGSTNEGWGFAGKWIGAYGAPVTGLNAPVECIRIFSARSVPRCWYISSKSVKPSRQFVRTHGMRAQKTTTHGVPWSKHHRAELEAHPKSHYSADLLGCRGCCKRTYTEVDNENEKRTDRGDWTVREY
jgi:hypothetical protein